MRELSEERPKNRPRILLGTIAIVEVIIRFYLSISLYLLG